MVHDHGHFEHLLHAVDAIDAATILSIVWFSFVMSWHCAAMCGPLVCARLAQVSAAGRSVFQDVVLYNAGRIFSYTALGAFVAAVSETVSDWVPRAGVALSISLAVIVAIQGCLLVLNREWAWAPRWVSAMTARLAHWSGSLKGRRRIFGFGVVTALLPCMTLTSALAAAAMSAEAETGALVMLGFVLGTIPVMVALPLVADNFASNLATKLPLNLLRRLAGVFLLIVSGITVLRIFH